MNTKRAAGFTIVELLIVIVVIAIIAAITIIAFNGIQDRARVSSNAASLQSAAKQLNIDQTRDGKYPDTLLLAAEGSGIKNPKGATFQYTVNNSVTPQKFCLSIRSGAVVSYIEQTGPPSQVSCMPETSVASTNSAGTSHLGTLSVSTPYENGDVIYLLAGSDNSTTAFATPSGYSQIHATTSVGNVNKLSLFRRVATDTNPSASVNVSRTGSGSWTLTSFIVKGADTTSPEDTAITNYRPGVNGSGTTNVTVTPMTATSIGGLALIGVVSNGTTTFGAPLTTARDGTYSAIGYHAIQDTMSESYSLSTTRSGTNNTVVITFIIKAAPK